MYLVLNYLFGWLLIIHSIGAESSIFTVDKGKVSFTSEAPLEIIYAESNNLRGAIDLSQNTFAFVVAARSFEGFNSPLQKEHFNEKYMESDLHSNITFSGKIIERLDFSIPGEYKVRAKGNFSIHGIEKERIIRSTLVVSKEKLYIRSTFSVLLADHNISIPKIVSQKISEEIQITLNIELVPKTG